MLALQSCGEFRRAIVDTTPIGPARVFRRGGDDGVDLFGIERAVVRHNFAALWDLDRALASVECTLSQRMQ
jgi:hypothetical protein